MYVCACVYIYLKTLAPKSVSTEGDRSPLQYDYTNIVAFNENQNCKKAILKLDSKKQTNL